LRAKTFCGIGVFFLVVAIFVSLIFFGEISLVTLENFVWVFFIAKIIAIFESFAWIFFGVKTWSAGA